MDEDLELSPDEQAAVDALTAGVVTPDAPEEPEVTPDAPEVPEEPEATEEPVAPALTAESVGEFLKANPQVLADALKGIAPVQAATAAREPKGDDPEPLFEDDDQYYYENSPSGVAQFTKDHNAWTLRQAERQRAAAQEYEQEVAHTASRLVDDDGFPSVSKDFLAERLRSVHPDIVRNMNSEDKETLRLLAKGYAAELAEKTAGTNGGSKIGKEPAKMPAVKPAGHVTQAMREAAAVVKGSLTDEEIREALKE